MLLLTQDELGFHADGLGDESAGDVFVTLKTFQQLLAGHVTRVEFREIVLYRGITEPTKDTATAVVLFDRDDAEVRGAEVIDVAIDMIRHHPVRDTSEPGASHELMQTVGMLMEVNIGVALSLTATASMHDTFAVGVFLPEVDTTVA